MEENLLGVSALEEQFVLRLPLELADLMREELEQNQLPKDFQIIFRDNRHASVTLHGQALSGFLLSLPTLVESHRTVDTTQYVKVADISKILLCVPKAEEAEWERRVERDGWLWMNGLTPPTMGMGRKVGSTRKLEELERIELEVQRLLEADEAAEATSYSLYQNDRLLKTNSSALLREESQSETLPADAEAEEELSSSYYMSDMEADDLAAELELDLQQQKVQEEEATLQEQVDELESKKAQVESVANPLIRARLQDAIAALEAELKQKQKGNK